MIEATRVVAYTFNGGYWCVDHGREHDNGEADGGKPVFASDDACDDDGVHRPFVVCDDDDNHQICLDCGEVSPDVGSTECWNCRARGDGFD